MYWFKFDFPCEEKSNLIDFGGNFPLAGWEIGFHHIILCMFKIKITLRHAHSHPTLFSSGVLNYLFHPLAVGHFMHGSFIEELDICIQSFSILLH